MTVKFICAIVMIIWGAIVTFVGGQPTQGTVWMVGAIIIAWMPTNKD